MSSEDTYEGLRHKIFYKSVMTENVEIIRKPENKPLANLPLENVKRIDFPFKEIAILPIHLAATYRKVQSLKALLDIGANAELRDQLGRNALHLVITHWPNIVPAWPMPNSKLRVTMETMQKRAEDCLHMLCKHGVDLNARVSCDTQHTSLHLAVRYGALPAVNVLASYGANVNLADTIGMTPLHMASGVLHASITRCLIELGANVNKAVESSGNTPLHLAVRAEANTFADTHANSIACIRALLEAGAEPNTFNHEGRTPLHEACGAGRGKVVDLLLRYGADANKLSRCGENCIFLFLEQKQNLRCTKLLGKLLHLTMPLKLTNAQGLLPKCLELPEYSSQRSQLIAICQEPRDLKSLCKVRIHQLYREADRPALETLLPKKILDFIFNFWECPPEIDFGNDENPGSHFSFHSDFIAPIYPNIHQPNTTHFSNSPPNVFTPQPEITNINAPNSLQNI